ncbi:hypothetical protein BDA99DRAFT_527802 [Phascolomyces articulosus]|uniref:Tyr recombinase domain-containing protein n=1 Tax=Phascolomyces articulosus TaxID=60185 RepID=A0AAD5JYJ1_9FUNG|nr:hypothetical protein BDA99DRAFT_527802 [Phascolomyces articulosus]
MSIEELKTHLSFFFTGLRKLDGSQYKTNNIDNCFSPIGRYLRNYYIQEESLNIMSDVRFGKLRKLVDGKMNMLLKEGGQRSNGADALSLERGRRLLSSEGYSLNTAVGLVRRVHYWIGLLGALRGDQHSTMIADMLEKTESRDKEGGIGLPAYKIEKKGENCEARTALIPPDAYSGPNVTAVADSEKYLSMRPNGCSPKLYLQPDRKGRLAFSSQCIGKNSLGKFLQDRCKNIGIDYKRITNHSLSKTDARRLFAAGVEEQLIMGSTEHHSTDAVRKYKLSTTEQRMQTAVLLTGPAEASSSSSTSLIQQTKKVAVRQSAETGRVATGPSININASNASGERVGEVLSGVFSATSKENISSFDINLNI